MKYIPKANVNLAHIEEVRFKQRRDGTVDVFFYFASRRVSRLRGVAFEQAAEMHATLNKHWGAASTVLTENP